MSMIPASRHYMHQKDSELSLVRPRFSFAIRALAASARHLVASRRGVRLIATKINWSLANCES
jgi:hypothetical protein